MFARLFDNPMAVVILVLIVVVVFGWKRLPDAARSLGRSTRILKSELGDMNDSKASRETVQGEAASPGQSQSGAVPGEAATAQQQPNPQPPPGTAPQGTTAQPGQQPHQGGSHAAG